MEEIVAPIEAEPVHVLLDGIDIFLLLLGRIGVVEAQVALTAEFLGDPEIEADRFGVADMEIAVRLGRKSRDDLRITPRCEIGRDDVADEIAPGIVNCFECRHNVENPVRSFARREVICPYTMDARGSNPARA